MVSLSQKYRLNCMQSRRIRMQGPHLGLPSALALGMATMLVVLVGARGTSGWRSSVPQAAKTHVHVT
jgi:hypothetical protein